MAIPFGSRVEITGSVREMNKPADAAVAPSIAEHKRKEERYMQHNHLFQKKGIILLCVVLVLAYIFLPHFHECLQTDCVICLMTQQLRDILVIVAVYAGMASLTACSIPTQYGNNHIFTMRDCTPVGLRVKLSN